MVYIYHVKSRTKNARVSGDGSQCGKLKRNMTEYFVHSSTFVMAEDRLSFQHFFRNGLEIFKKCECKIHIFKWMRNFCQHFYKKNCNFFNKVWSRKWTMKFVEKNLQRTYILNILNSFTARMLAASILWCMKQLSFSFRRMSVIVRFHSHTETGFKIFIVLMLQY